ncbi:MAG: type IX secretion system membrane protein PorP/SprF [Bacteroidetes bacterium]|jgi:type IX secretion system PorP/SprF family membrane protein|nr:type IX secretion system membrane protein PorP/SprF [Bacteroidota bacterium]MDA0930442.1 type IX secretion system membrane protein PorP/SprF [Bacteroidota bacterium]
MKKQIYLSFVFGLLGCTLAAQQLPQINQFQLNGFMVNPAFAGIEDMLDIKTGFRQQWSGIDGAPMTGWASAHMNLAKKERQPYPGSLHFSDTALYDRLFREANTSLRHGVGANLMYDRIGAFDRFQLQLAYSLHIPLFRNVMAAISPSIGMSNHGIRTGDVFMFEGNDPLYDQYVGMGSRFTHLDISAGALIYAPKWWVGYTANQLMQNKVYFGDQPTEAMLDIHHFIMAGTMWPLGDKFEIQVNGLMKLAGNNPLTFDAGARLRWNKLAWIGGSYRHNMGVQVMAGVNILPCLTLAYSYDFSLNQLRNVNTGTHEVVLGIRPFNPNRLQNRYLW